MTHQRVVRRRRVQLAVPASSEKMLAKAAASAADHVFLDLEDAVTPKEKISARAQVIDALKNLAWGDDRKSVVEGKSVSARVDLGGRRIIKKNKKLKGHIARTYAAD